MNHRVGNNLALVSSFLTMQQRAVKNPEAARALSAARTRVQAIASAHRKLRLGADFATVNASEVLGAVLEDICAGLPPGDLDQDRAHEVEPLEINARDAVSLGVLTSELVMNAIKHAFPPGESGEVQVVLIERGVRARIWKFPMTEWGGMKNIRMKRAAWAARSSTWSRDNSADAPSARREREDDARPGTRIRVNLVKLQVVQPA